jgi:hypothetical protein
MAAIVAASSGSPHAAHRKLGRLRGQVAVDDGEVVAVVLDIEHVAVSDGEALDDRH